MATGRTIEVVAKLRDSISPTLTKVSGKLKIWGQKTKAVFQTVKASVSGVTGAILGIIAVIGGAMFINAMKRVVEIGIEQEEAFKTLEGTLRSFGEEATAVTGRLADYSAELQQMTVHGDEAIMAVTNLLAQLTDLDEQGLKNATKATIGIADTMGMDLFGAASLVGKTIGSTTNALTRYGITVDMAGTQQERANEIMSNTARMFQLSQDKAQTFGGRLQSLGNNWGDLLETVSRVVLESKVLNGFIEGLSNTIRDKWIPQLEEWVASGETERWFETTRENFKKFLDFVADASIKVGEFLENTTDLVADLHFEWASMFRSLAGSKFGEWTGMSEELNSMADSFEKSGNAIKGWGEDTAQGFKDRGAVVKDVSDIIKDSLSVEEVDIKKPAYRFGQDLGDEIALGVDRNFSNSLNLFKPSLEFSLPKKSLISTESTPDLNLGFDPSQGWTRNFGTGGGKDPEESAGEKAALRFSTAFGDSLAEFMLDGDGASTMEVIGAGIGNILGAEVTESLTESMGGIGAGIMGGLVGGLIGRIFRKKKPAKIDKPIPVKVVNWGDMTGQLLKAGARRNVSPMITTGGNIMMSSNFGREARI